MNTPIYLDHNAATPIDPKVLEVVSEALERLYGNPSSVHSFGREARNSLTRARREVASLLEVAPSEIFFTSGGTESANLFLQGLKWRRLISCSSEHACVYEPASRLGEGERSCTFLKPGLWGCPRPEELEAAIDSETDCIALMAVNNETGVRSEIEAFASLAKERGVPLFVDGVALLGKELFKIPEGVSAMSFSGHKIHAPKGVGCLYLSKRSKLSPLFSGGAQEGTLRPGTENLPGILGFAEALRLAQEALPEAAERMRALRDAFERSLLETLPGVVVNGEGPRVCNTSNLAFLGVEGESLLLNLDLEGVAASHGSACSSGSLEPSRVLRAMGIPYQRAASSLRFSLSRLTTEEEVKRAASLLQRIVSKLRPTSPLS